MLYHTNWYNYIISLSIIYLYMYMIIASNIIIIFIWEKSIHSTFTTPLMKCKVGVLVPVCAQAHKQQAAKNQMGKCGARYLCASGQGGSRPEPHPAVTVQLYIRYLDWRLYPQIEDIDIACELLRRDCCHVERLLVQLGDPPGSKRRSVLPPSAA